MKLGLTVLEDAATPGLATDSTSIVGGAGHPTVAELVPTVLQNLRPLK